MKELAERFIKLLAERGKPGYKLGMLQRDYVSLTLPGLLFNPLKLTRQAGGMLMVETESSVATIREDQLGAWADFVSGRGSARELGLVVDHYCSDG